MDSYSYWRVLVTGTVDGSFVTIGDLEFRDWSGADRAVGGAADASSIYNLGAGADNAFDGLVDTFWSTDHDALPAWISYHFSESFPVASISIRFPMGYQYLNESPRDFEVQGSADGAQWSTVASFGDVEPFSAGESRVFPVQEIPLYEVRVKARMGETWVVRRVLVHRMDTGAVLGDASTVAADSFFTISVGPYAGAVYLVLLDDVAEPDRNALIFSGVTPVPSA